MRQKQIYILTALLTIFALTLNACGSSASNDSIIATSVAMTVQAQNTQIAQSAPALPGTDISPLPTSPTADATKAPPTAPPTGSSGNNLCTASATFVSETIPDGTIEQAGAQFTKIWHIKNSGTCAWDSTWQFVYYSGDVMGGAYVYPFPQPAAPGQIVDVPVVFTAPTVYGTYTGYWKIKSPWGTSFGDSDSGNPFWVQIVVGSGTPGKGTTTAYSITAVTYDIVRRPAAGCATYVDPTGHDTASIYYDITAYITSNGPVKITYFWKHSDGYNSGSKTLTFTEASTKSITESWGVRLGNSTNTRWDQIVVTDPAYQEYGKATFDFLCGK